MIKPYPPATEAGMRRLFDALCERERRLYAATEVQKLGRGGLTYLAHLFDCDKKTIRRGIRELKQPSFLPPGQSRKKGAAEKPV